MTITVTLWWPRWGVIVYPIVTGVASDVCMPSTHLVVFCAVTWAFSHIESLATWLFVQQLVKDNNKENIKALHCMPFLRKSTATDDGWNTENLVMLQHHHDGHLWWWSVYRQDPTQIFSWETHQSKQEPNHCMLLLINSSLLLSGISGVAEYAHHLTVKWSSLSNDVSEQEEMTAHSLSDHYTFVTMYDSPGTYNIGESHTQTYIDLTYWCLDKINTLRPTQIGRHFADAIFKFIFLNKNK